MIETLKLVFTFCAGSWFGVALAAVMFSGKDRDDD